MGLTLVQFRTARAAAVALLAALLAIAAAASAAVGAPADPTARISEVKTRDGIVQFLFSVKDLPTDAKLDPNSVLVQANGRDLKATAATPDQTQQSEAKLPLREVILTLDVSGSMQGDGIAAARSAAVAYAKSLPDDVRVGVVSFSDAPHVLLRPTTDRSKVASTIAALRANGNTALYDGLAAAAAVMNGLPGDAVKRLVVLSDGDDTTSTRSLDQAEAVLSSSHVTADVVAFRIPGNRAVLQQIASGSHGSVLDASDASALANAFAVAAKVFEQQVLVTVQVPDDLARTQATLETSLNAGSSSVTASVSLLLPNGVGGAKDTSTLVTSPPAASAGRTMLWVTCGIAFLAILLVALMFLWIPAEQREKAHQQARLAEAQRYALIGAAAQRGAARPTGPVESQFTQRTLAFVDRTMRAGGRRSRIVEDLDRAGLRLRPEEWVVFQIAAVAVVGAMVGLIVGSIWGFFVGAPLGYLACRAFLQNKISRRAAKFLDQLPDTLQLIAGSLRSGFSLSQALVGVVREGSEPTAGEFSRALNEVRLGAELEDALEGVAARMKCPDLHWVVMAIEISREVGGNLAEVLQTTVSTMRERAQLRGQVRVLSAEGRISAKILIGLPFLMAAYLLTFKRGYLNPLVNTAPGIAMLILGSCLLTVGIVWVNQLVKIEV